MYLISSTKHNTTSYNEHDAPEDDYDGDDDAGGKSMRMPAKSTEYIVDVVGFLVAAILCFISFFCHMQIVSCRAH